jgi:hypothetical protein
VPAAEPVRGMRRMEDGGRVGGRSEKGWRMEDIFILLASRSRKDSPELNFLNIWKILLHLRLHIFQERTI